MNKEQLQQLQNTTQRLVSYCADSMDAYGITIAGLHWTDGVHCTYHPTDKLLADFTIQECLDSIEETVGWLNGRR